jgi:hypothetical protein
MGYLKLGGAESEDLNANGVRLVVNLGGEVDSIIEVCLEEDVGGLKGTRESGTVGAIGSEFSDIGNILYNLHKSEPL